MKRTRNQDWNIVFADDVRRTIDNIQEFMSSHPLSILGMKCLVGVEERQRADRASDEGNAVALRGDLYERELGNAISKDASLVEALDWFRDHVIEKFAEVEKTKRLLPSKPGGRASDNVNVVAAAEAVKSLLESLQEVETLYPREKLVGHAAGRLLDLAMQGHEAAATRAEELSQALVGAGCEGAIPAEFLVSQASSEQRIIDGVAKRAIEGI